VRRGLAVTMEVLKVISRQRPPTAIGRSVEQSL